MQVALIPPKSRLSDTLYTDMQLLLPQLFLRDKDYAEHYSNMLRADTYTILDNGAAEAEQVDNDELEQLVRRLMPHEFALPDILGETDTTVASAFNYLHGQQVPHSLETWVGFVAQGRTVDDACAGVNAILDSSVGDKIKVIYIPRLLLRESGNKRARLEVAEFVHNRYPELGIHLFGASTEWVQEIKEASKVEYIRSMDTSLPYNYALAGIPIEEDTTEKVGRPDNYFEAVLTPAQLDVARWNVDKIMEWSRW